MDEFASIWELLRDGVSKPWAFELSNKLCSSARGVEGLCMQVGESDALGPGVFSDAVE